MYSSDVTTGDIHDKKALDYMKERFLESQEAKSHSKIIREPKKLDIAWGK